MEFCSYCSLCIHSISVKFLQMNKVELELLLMLPTDNHNQCTIIQQFIQQSVVLFSIFDQIHLFATSINERKLGVLLNIYSLQFMNYVAWSPLVEQDKNVCTTYY